MPSTPKKPEDKITPRHLLTYNRLGTGSDVDRTEYYEFLRQIHGRNEEDPRRVRGTVIAYETRQMITLLTGYSPAKLHELAPVTHLSNNAQAKATRTQIRNQILLSLPFLNKYQPADKEAGLRELSRKADDYIRSLIMDYFPDEEDVQMADEVATCSDVETLILMAFHDGLDPKIKFEASRKLHLMKFFGEISNHNRKMVDHDKALNYMTDFFNRRINKVPEGSRLGQGFDRYLITTHAGEDLAAVSYEIRDIKPESQITNPLVRVTPMRCRRTVVTDEKGKERVIFFRKHPRDKEPEARLTKALRYNSLVGERDTDLNGIRLVFDSAQDWSDFRRMFKEELKNEIEEEIKELQKNETNPDRRETLDSRLNNIDASITINRKKGDVNGETKFDGSSTASSSKMKMHKFDLKVIRADGRIHTYELQVFNPDGYADYLYRKGVSWEEYSVNRFFEDQVDELIFPEKIYSQIDRVKLHKKCLKRAQQRIWNGNGNGHSTPAPKPEKEPAEAIEGQKC